MRSPLPGRSLNSRVPSLAPATSIIVRSQSVTATERGSESSKGWMTVKSTIRRRLETAARTIREMSRPPTKRHHFW